MKQALVMNSVLKLALVGALGLQVACSSGGSDSGSTDVSISGTISAAPVEGADVSVVDATPAHNEVVASVKTDSNGKYSLVIPNGSLGQDLIIKSTGGTFVDEAKGGLPGAAGDMYAYALAGSLKNGSMVSATPGSTIVADLVMNHGKTMGEAEAIFAVAFAYTPDISITPADATTEPATDEDETETLAGFRAAVFSQLAMDLGLKVLDISTPIIAEQFELFAALARDLTDGKLDGVDDSGAVAIGTTNTSLEVDIQNRFSTAMVNFHASGYNNTKLKNDQIGNLPFGKVALIDNPTSAYKIKYVTEMMPMVGKTTFQFQITDLADNNVSDATPTIMPKMYMADMAHSSPATAVTYNGTEELYTATVYYLMPSMMGYWDLKVDVDGDMMTDTDVAYFYPSVMADVTAMVSMLAVGDKNDDDVVDGDDLALGADVIKNMDGTFSARTYIIFKEEVSDGAGSLSVFIAAKEHMMSFPAVLVHGSLELDMMGMLPAMNVDSVTVEMSSDAGVNWKTALPEDGKDGIWKATSLSLTAGEINEVRVKLKVNGEAKVANSTDYQTLFVTP